MNAQKVAGKLMRVALVGAVMSCAADPTGVDRLAVLTQSEPGVYPGILEL